MCRICFYSAAEKDVWLQARSLLYIHIYIHYYIYTYRTCGCRRVHYYIYTYIFTTVYTHIGRVVAGTFTTIYVYMCTIICVLVLLHMCPRTTSHVSSYYSYLSSYCYIFVLVLLHMCPHTAAYVSSYYLMCPHTTTYVSSYSNLPQLLLDELHLSFFADGWYYREGVGGGGKSPKP